jgi:hypothetical protein
MADFSAFNEEGISPQRGEGNGQGKCSSGAKGEHLG